MPRFLFRAVRFTGSRLRILDQTRLPEHERYLYPRSAADVAKLIRRLSVRGAPAIGVAAGYGLAIEALRFPDQRLRTWLRRAAGALAAARPTAVNLEHAVERVRRLLADSAMRPSELRRSVIAEARLIEAEEISNSVAMARCGARLVPQNATILTICNTGALAAPGMGTALGVIFQAFLEGKHQSVLVCETRPLLQGSRLTTLELKKAGIPFTLITDNTAASVMGRCDLVLVGADRIVANGDFANKVGTRALALLAKESGKRFYVVAPVSSFDPNCTSGRQIVIEERDGEEVRSFRGCRAAPRNVPVFNPAFDVTPGKFVTGFITERGVLRPPFRRLSSRA